MIDDLFWSHGWLVIWSSTYYHYASQDIRNWLCNSCFISRSRAAQVSWFIFTNIQIPRRTVQFFAGLMEVEKTLHHTSQLGHGRHLDEPRFPAPHWRTADSYTVNMLSKYFAGTSAMRAKCNFMFGVNWLLTGIFEGVRFSSTWMGYDVWLKPLPKRFVSTLFGTDQVAEVHGVSTPMDFYDSLSLYDNISGRALI